MTVVQGYKDFECLGCKRYAACAGKVRKHFNCMFFQPAPWARKEGQDGGQKDDLKKGSAK